MAARQPFRTSGVQGLELKMAQFKDRTGLANYDKRDQFIPWTIIVGKVDRGQCEVLCTNENGTVWEHSWVSPEWARNACRRIPPQAVTNRALSLGHNLRIGVA